VKALFAVLAAASLFAASPATQIEERHFQIGNAGEVQLTLRARCGPCDWGVPGREATVLRISVDGKYSQHVPLVQGDRIAAYRVLVGALDAGTHRLTIERDTELSASGAGPFSIEQVTTDVVEERLAPAFAPILYARPNTVGKFTDAPLVMWYEVAPTPRGRQFRYSVIFTNEDGGTPTDRLMATWGRTTDIEYVYGVEFDDAGRVLSEEFQGPGHEVPPFRGRHEGGHPLLWVSTDNNMVSESGPTTIRYALAPERADLKDVSREAVMDRNPWTYAVAAKELVREGKIDASAAPGSGRIPDPREFVNVEACVDLQAAALSVGVRAVDGDRVTRWHESDRGLPEFRIARTGCFRAAVPVPSSSTPDALRFRAYSKPDRDQPAAAGKVVLIRYRTFRLGSDFAPEPRGVVGNGAAREIPVDGDAIEVPLARNR
jgi:hypothetical protein